MSSGSGKQTEGLLVTCSPLHRDLKGSGEQGATPRLLLALCAIAAVEGADLALLPSATLALQRDLGLSLINISQLSLVQALAQVSMAPLWGMLADRRIMTRRSLMIIGTCMQGTITMALSATETMPTMLALRALNGLMLAGLKPLASGIIADVTSENSRGRAFGWVQFALSLGMCASGMICTPLSELEVAGMHGWRVAFFCIGGTAAAIGASLTFLMVEPDCPGVHSDDEHTGICSLLSAELSRLWSFFGMPSFCIMVIQGCFGGIPWKAFVFQTLFFQVAGLGDVSASIIQASGQIANGLGGLLGGYLGDRSARWNPINGRPIVAQISTLAGIPLAYLMFTVQPPDSVGAFPWYLTLVVLTGLTATWCASAVNLPILSALVPPENRSTIIAWELSLEGCVSVVFGNAAVGILAQTMFGYDLGHVGGIGDDINAAHALGKALMLICLGPWVVCLGFYSLLHWTLPKDLGETQWKAQSLELELQAPKEEFARSPQRSRLSEAAALVLNRVSATLPTVRGSCTRSQQG